MDCVVKTVKQEGPMAFYKGTLSPLAGIAFCVSIQFAALGQMKRTFSRWNQGGELTPLQFYLSGGVAGVANSFVSGPVEHIRTRMQVQTAGQPAEYKSTADCLRKIAGQYGLRGVYKGQMITMLREWQGYGGYFFAYEWLAQQATKRQGIQVSQLPTWQVMCFGAAAGYAMWLPIFPLDVIKSKIQTDSPETGKQKYRGWIHCFRQVLKQEGMAGLYRGFVPCMLRAAPVNAATFVAYEFAMRSLLGGSR